MAATCNCGGHEFSTCSLSLHAAPSSHGQFKSPKFLGFKYSTGMSALPTSFVFFSLCLC